MPRSLVDLPPELLVRILCLLPIQSLLRSGLTCHHLHALATSSMHTLSLGIYTTQISAIISKLATTQYPQPKTITSAFVSPTPSESGSQVISRTAIQNDDLFAFDSSESDPFKVSVFIPDSQYLNYTMLRSFQTKLTTSILLRHGETLRHLDLSLWTLTIPLAQALASLPAVRNLSIRMEDFLHLRNAPLSCLEAQRTQERQAWTVLSQTAVWAPRINALRIEGAQVTTAQLARLLRRSRWCRELWLCRCGKIRSDVWAWLARGWGGRGALRILGVMQCGLSLDEGALEAIGQMAAGLHFLSLFGSPGVDGKTIERKFREEWRFPELVAPVPNAKGQDADMVIEVDPAYM